MIHMLLTLGPDHSQPSSHMRTFSHKYIYVYGRDVGHVNKRPTHRVYKRGPSRKLAGALRSLNPLQAFTAP